MAQARRYTPYGERVFPADEGLGSLLRDLLLVGGGSLLIAFAAQVALPLPFTPVPVTGQTFAVLLVGFSLGTWRGGASVLLYLLQGGLGLPFFAQSGNGWATFAGPSGGYLIGFVFAAAAVGFLGERGWDREFRTTLLGMLGGNAIILTCGVLWLAPMVGWHAVWMKGFWPFLLGDLLKALLAAGILPTAWGVIKRKT